MLKMLKKIDCCVIVRDRFLKLEGARKSAYLRQAKCTQTDTHTDKSNLIISSNSLRSVGGYKYTAS